MQASRTRSNKERYTSLTDTVIKWLVPLKSKATDSSYPGAFLR